MLLIFLVERYRTLRALLFQFKVGKCVRNLFPAYLYFIKLYGWKYFKLVRERHSFGIAVVWIIILASVHDEIVCSHSACEAVLKQAFRSTVLTRKSRAGGKGKQNYE